MINFSPYCMLLNTLTLLDLCVYCFIWFAEDCFLLIDNHKEFRRGISLDVSEACYKKK